MSERWAIIGRRQDWICYRGISNVSTCTRVQYVPAFTIDQQLYYANVNKIASTLFRLSQWLNNMTPFAAAQHYYIVHKGSTICQHLPYFYCEQ